MNGYIKNNISFRFSLSLVFFLSIEKSSMFINVINIVLLHRNFEMDKAEEKYVSLRLCQITI